MAAFDTYTQLRQAEDVQDEIYVISPIDAPVASMSRTIRATGKIHQWTEDKMAAAGANRAAEGADAPANSETAVVELKNACQIMTKSAKITGTLEEVDKYGRDSEMAYQLELRYGELANDEELAIVGAPGGTRQTYDDGSGGSAGVRQMASLHSQLDASVVVDGAAYTTYVELEAGLQAAHLACYNAGGNPTYLLTDPSRSTHMSNLAYATGRNRDIRNERRLVNVIDLYQSQFGELDVVLDRNQDDCWLGLDFNYLATPVLRATRDWPIAKTGDSDTRQILRESTCAVLNTKAHFMLDNIPVSLTT